MGRAVGIDVAEARKGLDIVALDDDRAIVLARGRATVADVTAVVADLRPDVICIDSPPEWAASGRSRTAERALRKLGITAYSTPTDPGDHPFYRWMRAGFAVYDALADHYPRYRGGDVRGTAAEVFPEATAIVLAGRRRTRDEPKVAFRRGVLEGHGVDGRALRTADGVDAALAALTGLLALDAARSIVGDPADGVILLPVSALPHVPLTPRVAPSSPASPAAASAGPIPSGVDERRRIG